ncbi:MAG TPA: mechanosensitive ion channel [Chromatiales bacterium]|nr:mechanosensitive ion channel [Chromatiales bacterium]
MDQILEPVQYGLDLLKPYPYLQAVLIVVLFLGLAKFVDGLCGGLVRRLAARTQSDFDNQVIDILHRPIFVTIASVGLILATHRIQLEDRFLLATVGIVKTILIWVWVVFGLRFSRLALDTMSYRQHGTGFVQPSTRPLIGNVMAVLIVLVGIYAVLVTWDINVTGLVASAGIVGLALSFAAQDTLSNLFAGVAILMDRPYKIGDFIILDSGERGQVTQIGLRSTRMVTRDDVEITLPNSAMGSAKIINETGGPRQRYRIRVAVGVAYGSDIDQVMDCLLEVSKGHPKVSRNPEPRVRFRRFGDSSLDFELLCWIADPGQRGLVQHELNCAIYKAFAAANIQIPFPQRDLHIKEFPSQAPDTS